MKVPFSKVKRIMIFVLLALIVVPVIVLCFGRQLVTILDKFALSKREVIELDMHRSSISFNELTLGGSNFPHVENVRVNEGQVVLEEANNEIILGRATQSKNEPHVFDFHIDSGDTVQFSFQHSILSWPTPFQMNFMTGHTPEKKRNAYYNLTWSKRDGSSLLVRWKFEQWKYKGNDWGDWRSRFASDEHDGLIELVIKKSELDNLRF